MATQSEKTTYDISTQDAPLSVRAAAGGFLWGAIMLGLLAWWLYASNLEPKLPFWGGAAALAAVSLGLFLWYCTTAWRAKGNMEVLSAAESRMRPVFSGAMFAGAVVLLALAVWLCIKEKWDGVAQFSSMIVMVLIAAGAGASLRLSWSGPATRQHILETMLQMRQRLSLVLMVLGGVLAAVGLWELLRSPMRDFGKRFPEGGGMFLIGLVFFSAGLWTKLTLEKPATTYTMRMLLLYVGGLTGFLIAFMTALRVMMWWKTYFMGGLRVWQGEEGWRFWVCTYVRLTGLALLFGSLLLSQVDIRSSAPMRRLLYGYNAVLTGLLLLETLVVANILIFVTLPSNVLWTKTMGMHSLSTRSQKLLEGLKEPVKVYVLMPRYSGVYLEVRDLLDNCQDVTNRIEVEYLSPDLDSERYRRLAQTYPELEKQQTIGRKGGEGYGRGLLIVYGTPVENAKLDHAFIPDTDLADQKRDPSDPQQRKVSSVLFNGEEVLMRQISLLASKNTKLTIYFTQDNREPHLLDAGEVSQPRYDPRVRSFAGLANLSEKLRKDNFVVRGLLFGVQPPKFREDQGADFKFTQETAKGPHKIPDDCDVLVIVNPLEAFAKEALEGIDDYMEKRAGKGKLIVLSRLGVYRDEKGLVVAKDGMDELCKKYGVQLKNDYVLSYPPESEFMVIRAMVPEGAGNKNNFAREFAKTTIPMIMPRTMESTKLSSYQAEAILEVSSPPNGKYTWAETDTTRYADPIRYIIKLEKDGKVGELASKSPLTVGMAVSDRDSKPRAVILGDYLPVCNAGVRSAPQNYDFFRSALSWLANRQIDDPGISPRESGVYEVDRNDVNGARMIWLPLGLTVLTFAGMGAGVWIVRRK